MLYEFVLYEVYLVKKQVSIFSAFMIGVCSKLVLYIRI